MVRWFVPAGQPRVTAGPGEMRLTYIRTYFEAEPHAVEGADEGFVEYQLTRAR
jgi:hypothetical protein